eukprot:GHVU01128724.1.p2 GENE.GHVU01128724.1~~GHVU01128724.1.p2  ORF type:complete len:106 (-),score=1.07 GHVU01128724.1:483-800(-)
MSEMRDNARWDPLYTTLTHTHTRIIHTQTHHTHEYAHVGPMMRMKYIYMCLMFHALVSTTFSPSRHPVGRESSSHPSLFYCIYRWMTGCDAMRCRGYDDDDNDER